MNEQQTTALIDPSKTIPQAQWDALTSSIFVGARPESIQLAISYCFARNLDILKKPVHIVPMYVKDAVTGQSAMRDVIMTGISEIRTTASRTKQYAGQDAPAFSEAKEIDFNGMKVNVPEFCTVTVYRVVNGERVAFSHTEYFTEACAIVNKTKQLNSMWFKRPRGQLAKCAEAGALRKAFPEEIGGEITADEVSSESHASNFDNPNVIEHITEDNTNRLNKAFAMTNTDIPALLKEYNVESISDLTNNDAASILEFKRNEVIEMKQLQKEQPPVQDQVETETPIQL